MAKRKIHLHGRLAGEFGEMFEMDVATAGEAIRALHANFPERFLEVIREGAYYLVCDDPDEGMGIDEELINQFKLGAGDLHIIPAVEGSARGNGKGGGIKAILGVALIGIAIFMSGGTLAAPLAGMGQAAFTIGGMHITWGNIALMGVALAISGASSMLSSKDKPKDETKRDDSFSFSGPINTNEQGNPVPLIYGRVMTGGQPISSGVDIENIGSFSPSAGSGVPGLGQVMIDGNIQTVFNPWENSGDGGPNS